MLIDDIEISCKQHIFLDYSPNGNGEYIAFNENKEILFQSNDLKKILNIVVNFAITIGAILEISECVEFIITEISYEHN